MRLRKQRKKPGMPPDQVEALGACTPADFEKAKRITDQLLGTPPEKVEALAPVMSRAAQFFVDRFGSFETSRGGAPACGVVPRLAEGDSPLLIGGERSLSNLTRESTGSPEFPGYSESLVVDRNGNPVIRPGVRCIQGQKVGIDWVSCVFEPGNAWMYFFATEVFEPSVVQNDDSRVAAYVQKVFGWILGFDKGAEENQRWKIYESGLNGYKYAIGMPYRSGIVHVGHSSGTCLVTVTGQGALAANPGWEFRLYRFLKDVRGWLTRIDMAYDDYEGEYFAVRSMRQLAKEGGFIRGGHPPRIELRGAWEQDDPNNSGLTLYIGSRMSGKYARIYEKGKQLGDEESPWVRAEVELHNSCYQLTLDMLLRPSQWFVAFYPPFEAIQYAGNRVELEYRTRVAEKTIESSAKWIKHQAGGHLAALREIYGDDQKLLDALVRPDAIPQQFLIANQALKSAQAPSASLTDEPGWVEA